MIRDKRSIIELARPSLFRVAPLTAALSWVYILSNVLVFLTLFFIYRPATQLIIVNDFLNFQVWALGFLALAIANSYFLVKNDWNKIRNVLLLDVYVKSVWAITLIARTFISPRTTIFTTILWGTFVLTQIISYIYFMPEVTEGRDNEQQLRG